MSWRDDTDSSETRGGTKDGNGGTSTSGGTKDTKGGNYTFRNVPGAKTPTMGNWNTGGDIVGFGNLTGGIRRANIAMPRARPMPTGFTAPPQVIPPLPIAPIVSPITPPAVYGAPPTRVDLNPATLAPLTNFQSTFPARPGVRPSVGVVGKDQSRLPGMGGSGTVGGGMGGGGGGGW